MAKLEPSAADLRKIELEKAEVERKRLLRIRLANVNKEPTVGYTNPVLILPTGPPTQAKRAPNGFKKPPHFN
jgi:hypothetical protein